MSTVFISWIAHHGRSAAIASALGAEPLFITGGSGPAPVRYLRAAIATRRALRSPQRPSAAIVMLPPLPALLATTLSRRSLPIAGDLHSGVFNDPKWSWALVLTLRILRKRGIAVVTNASLAQTCRDRGVETVVLHDMIEDYQEPLGAPPLDLIRGEYVFLPVTYAPDEPIDSVLAAAAASPAVTFVLTGRAPERVRQAAPSNVVLTGFVAQTNFESLLRNAGAVAALTTREDTMQRAGYEALSAGVPLIASSTQVLREYFEDSAVFSDSSAEGLQAAVQEIFADREAWIARVEAMKVRKQAEQTAALETLREWTIR